MLISVVSSQEFVPMELPDPAASQAVMVAPGERVVLNCRAGASEGVALYSLGANPPEPLSALAAQLAAWRRTSPNLGVVIRADRRLPYSDVRAAMAMVAEQKIEVLNVAALTND
jgi:biopolymer transport protein ExbD